LCVFCGLVFAIAFYSKQFCSLIDSKIRLSWGCVYACGCPFLFLTLTPSPSRTKFQTPNPETQMFWVGLDISTCLGYRRYCYYYFIKYKYIYLKHEYWNKICGWRDNEMFVYIIVHDISCKCFRSFSCNILFLIS